MGRKRRDEQRQFAETLRANGGTWVEIAEQLGERWPELNPRAAMRLAHGWTQHEAAIEWNKLFDSPAKTYKDISDMETRRPGFGILGKLARLYQCAVSDLIANDPDVSDYRHLDDARQAPNIPALHPVVHVPTKPVDRRDFLAGTAAINALTVLDLLPIPADSESLTERIEAMRAGNAGLDVETLDGLGRITLGYRQAYGSVGASMLIGPAQGTLRLLTELVPDASDAQQDRIVSMIGQMGALIGTLHMLDLGDFATAQSYLAICVRAAQQINDAELMAFGLGCRAFHASYGGQPSDGVAFADRALEHARPGIAPRTHGWLAAVGSEMHAMAGEDRECDQLLDTAAEQLQRVDPAEPWLGIGVFNADKLTAYRGGDLVRLGRYGEAQGSLHRALDRLGPTLKKHRTTAHVDLAEAYIKDGKLDDGIGHAMTALDIVSSTRHANSLYRVETLYRATRSTSERAAHELGERLMDLKGAL